MDENVDEQAGPGTSCSTYTSARSRAMGGPARIAGSTLVVLCRFGLDPFPGNGGWGGVLILRGLRAFIRDRVIFFANPLPPARLAAQAADFVKGGDPSWVDVVCCGIATDVVPEGLPSLRAVHYCEGPVLSVDPAAYDTVLLAYSDPLGLGWGRLEKQLLRSCRRAPLLLNGRGRVAHLTAETRRMLRLRRLLARTRAAELAMAAVVIPVAAFLALKDKLSDRV